MNIVSMYRKPPLEVVGVDSGGFHHVSADITSTLRLVSWAVVGAIPMPTPSWAIITIICWIITTASCLLYTWGKDFRQVFSRWETDLKGVGDSGDGGSSCLSIVLGEASLGHNRR